MLRQAAPRPSSQLFPAKCVLFLLQLLEDRWVLVRFCFREHRANRRRSRMKGDLQRFAMRGIGLRKRGEERLEIRFQGFHCVDLRCFAEREPFRAMFKLETRPQPLNSRSHVCSVTPDMEAGMQTDSPEAKEHAETSRRLNDGDIKSVVHVDERCRLRFAGPDGLARCDGAADEVGYYTGKRRLTGETEQERLGLIGSRLQFSACSE
jgi:hypothetical protein